MNTRIPADQRRDTPNFRRNKWDQPCWALVRGGTGGPRSGKGVETGPACTGDVVEESRCVLREHEPERLEDR